MKSRPFLRAQGFDSTDRKVIGQMFRLTSDSWGACCKQPQTQKSPCHPSLKVSVSVRDPGYAAQVTRRRESGGSRSRGNKSISMKHWLRKECGTGTLPHFGQMSKMCSGTRQSEDKFSSYRLSAGHLGRGGEAQYPSGFAPDGEARSQPGVPLGMGGDLALYRSVGRLASV